MRSCDALAKNEKVALQVLAARLFDTKFNLKAHADILHDKRPFIGFGFDDFRGGFARAVTGFGMKMMMREIDHLGATLRVEQLDKGTAFIVDIPNRGEVD